ncbi:MAG: CYTH domain-containing protein [Gammaproteobacteria bacterium]|nr:CYTH domain-containing protein [Gammaproteobacteria bacterium]
MGREIERKFLIDLDILGELTDGMSIKQGYIATQDYTAVRVRIKDANAWLSLKGKVTGISRLEFEYPIPVAEAEEIMTKLCSGGIVEKTRYELKVNNHLWEIDIFSGDNEGLVVAEVELEDEDEPLELPEWIVQEVTEELRYYNVNLLELPYKAWTS